MQAVGIIAAVGDDMSRADLKPGSAVATVSDGGFSEYREVRILLERRRDTFKHRFNSEMPTVYVLPFVYLCYIFA